MSDEIRPSTGKTRPVKRHTTPAYDEQPGANPSKDASKFKERFQVIRSARERKPLPEPPLLPQQQPLQASNSKFLQRYGSIKGMRESLEGEGAVQEEVRRRAQFEHNRKVIFMEDKLSTLSSHDSLLDSQEPPSEKTALRKVGRTQQCLPDPAPSRPTSAGVEFVSLMKIAAEELLVKMEQSKVESKQQMAKEGSGRGVLTGYWQAENRFVSLIPLERNEKVSFQHSHILPIYAEVSLNGRRYVLSDEYKQCSLRNLLEQFGPFGESLAKHYLWQVAVGLQHMHFHRRPHNRLSPSAILYNRDGQLLLNALPATSFPPSREELASTRALHSFAPEFLLSKGFSRSLKNDVWALGCLALLMLTTTGLTRSQLHPYNKKIFANQEEAQMIDNIRQLNAIAFSDPFEERIYRNQTKTESLSEAAISFITTCLHPLAEQRPNIQTLLQHQFFQGN